MSVDFADEGVLIAPAILIGLPPLLTDRYDESNSDPAAVPVSVLKQEEEDIQRAIAESEALARNQQGRAGYVPAASTSYGQQSSSYSGYQAPNSNSSGTNFFTQSDGKALPDIQHDHQANSQQIMASAPVASPAQSPSRVKALYDFEPQEEGELAFRKGDIIRVVNSAYEGWWKGELDGRVGIFPLTYIVSHQCILLGIAVGMTDLTVSCRRLYRIQLRRV